jgi:hypothetical protein
MTTDLQTSPLEALKAIGIINANHVRRALADPEYAELAGNPDPAHHLVWLVGHDIMEEDELKQAVRFVNDHYAGEELERHNQVLGGALVILGEIREKFNNQWFDTLVSENIITAAERERAVGASDSDNLLASPAAALAWMALSDVISSERLHEIRATAAAGSPERAAILTEAEDIFARTNAAVRSAVVGAIFPGPRWLWIAAPVLFVGFLVWTFVKPASVPDCTDSDVARTINSMMFKAGVDSRVDLAMRGVMDAKPSTPRVHAIREVGFATETRTRGCVGKLKMDDNEIPYAFTIAPSGTEKGEFAVIGAEPAIVQARYGKLDSEGKFLNKAEPLGRAEVERAFRAGVDSAGISRSSAFAQMHQQRSSALSTMAPERTREIAEIEPMAPCREIKAGVAYSCRLLVERNDAMLAAFGAGSGTLIDSEFTFERDSATAPWRVSAGFAEEFAKAVVDGRVKAMSQ